MSDLIDWQARAGLPHPPTEFTIVFRQAAQGEGERAYEWADKPYRLIFDLCRELERIAATPDPRITQLEAANAQLEADRVELVERAASAWRKVQQANAVGDPHGFSFHARELTATLSRIGEDGK